MAKSRAVALLLLLAFTLFLQQVPLVSSRPFRFRYRPPTLRTCKFDGIYQLGDSISDTGNLIREAPIGSSTPFTRLPYGQTFFKNATGRCSNGLLMIDFIAYAAGVPLLNPYKNVDANFSHGANFAVAGSTALPTETLAAKNIASPVTNSSLNVQLDWMSSHFNSTCHSHKQCSEKLDKSLFMVGEIGGNDYNYALLQAKPIEEVKNMLVPDVVDAIKNAVRKVITEYGAKHVVVPGNFPIGCFPIYLTAFQTNNSSAYDEHHCLKDLNEFSIYHNEKLQEAIKELNEEFPNSNVVYGDYYNAFKWLFHKATYMGFNPAYLQRACCGTGGSYDFSLMKPCGVPGVPVCVNPRKRISWDGIHLTQSAYRVMARWIVKDILPKLQCSSYHLHRN